MTQSPCYQAFAFRNFSSGYRCTTSKYKAPLITIDTWMMITKKNDEVKPKKTRKRTMKQRRSCIIYQVILSCAATAFSGNMTFSL